MFKFANKIQDSKYQIYFQKYYFLLIAISNSFLSFNIELQREIKIS